MRLLRLEEVKHQTGLSRTTIYRWMDENKFPEAVPMGERSIGWVETEIEEWIEKKIEERDAAKQKS